MAVFTDLSETDCAEIANVFRLGHLTSVIGIADGDRETTFLFRAEHGEFIVTLFETGAEPADLEQAFRTMERLATAGVPCPTTRRTGTDSATVTVAGKLVAVVSFVPGSPVNEVTPGRCRALGACAARIHQTLARPRAPGRPDLPRGAVHGALDRDNVFFLGEAVSGVINFRLRHDDLLVAELAQLLVSWTAGADGMLEECLAAALVHGYEDVRMLSAAECRALPAFVMAATASSLAEHDRIDEVEANALRAFLSVRAGFGAGSS